MNNKNLFLIQFYVANIPSWNNKLTKEEKNLIQFNKIIYINNYSLILIILWKIKKLNLNKIQKIIILKKLIV